MALVQRRVAPVDREQAAPVGQQRVVAALVQVVPVGQQRVVVALVGVVPVEQRAAAALPVAAAHVAAVLLVAAVHMAVVLPVVAAAAARKNNVVSGIIAGQIFTYIVVRELRGACEKILAPPGLTPSPARRELEGVAVLDRNLFYVKIGQRLRLT